MIGCQFRKLAANSVIEPLVFNIKFIIFIMNTFFNLKFLKI